MQQPRRNDENGFVLIEMMIVLVVLGVLASLVVLSLTQFSQGANDARDGAGDDACKTAVAAYQVEHDGAAPTAEADLAPYFEANTPDCLP